MNIVVIFVLLLSTVFLFLTIFSKHTISRTLCGIGTFILVSIMLCSFYQEVGIPLFVDNPTIYSPFDNGKIFRTCWSSVKGDKYLFSVAYVTREKENVLPKIFWRRFSVSGLFIVLDKKFYYISEQQKDEIFKMDLNEEQIKKYLHLE